MLRLSTLTIHLDAGVAGIELNRPDKANALEEAMWQDLRTAMRWADTAPEVRAVVLRGAGRHFCAGIDLAMLAGLERRIDDPCPARSRDKLRRLILDLQDCLTAIERCAKPVLAAIDGACVGGGLDLALACDMRYCTTAARFSIKEVDIGMTADVGTLQRLPRLIGEGLARELAYTGRPVDGTEAAAIRLVNRCHADADTLYRETAALAAAIAAKSPLAVRGSKEMISYARDHTVADSLNYVATWNAAMLLSADLAEAGRAARERRPPRFAD